MTVRITSGLVASSHPRDQRRLPDEFYRRSSAFGYWQTTPAVALFWVLLVGIGWLPLAGKIACALLLPLVAYRLTFVIHDCSHHTLFARAAENEFWGWLCGSMLFTSFPEFRRLHWIHHRYYREAADPQGCDYNGLQPGRDRVWRHLLKPLFFLNALEKAAAFLALQHCGMTADERRAARQRGRPSASGNRGAAAAIVAMQAVIFAVSTGLLSFLPGYLLFLLPMVSMGLFISRVRSYLEHGALDRATDDAAKIARTHRSNFLERNLLAGIFFNYHNEHHRWPQVPSRHLPRVHREITAGKLPPRDYSPSYWASLRKLGRESMRRAPSAPAGDCPFPQAPQIATQTVPCGMCGDDEHEPYAEGYDYEYQSCSNLWRLVRCLSCGNVYLRERPAPDQLGVIYPANYYAYNYEQQINPLARRAKEWLDARRFSGIRRRISGRLERYLDIGCGNGRYLRAMVELGLTPDRIYGIELDAAVAGRLRAEGFQVYHCPIEDAAELPTGAFQLVTLFSVLEHVASPRATLERVFELLAPGGLVVFEAPNLNSLNGRIFRRSYWGGYHIPRHWNLFSAETAQQTAEALGYEVVAVQRTLGHAFWLWSLHHYLRFERGWDRLGRWLNPCHCLPGLVVATAGDMVRAKLRCQTDNMLMTLRKPLSAAGELRDSDAVVRVFPSQETLRAAG